MIIARNCMLLFYLPIKMIITQRSYVPAKISISSRLSSVLTRFFSTTFSQLLLSHLSLHSPHCDTSSHSPGCLWLPKSKSVHSIKVLTYPTKKWSMNPPCSAAKETLPMGTASSDAAVIQSAERLYSTRLGSFLQ